MLVGLVEEGPAERGELLGALVAREAFEQGAAARGLECGELLGERAGVRAEACGGGVEGAGAGVDLEASDAFGSAWASDGVGGRFGVAVAGGEALWWLGVPRPPAGMACSWMSRAIVPFEAPVSAASSGIVRCLVTYCSCSHPRSMLWRGRWFAGIGMSCASSLARSVPRWTL